MDAAATWDLVAPLLAARGHHVVAMDMRGFGDGARIASGGYYHFADYIFDVADLVDAVLGNASLHVVGHSMGGTIATMFAGTFPERVSKLALLEGLGPPDNTPDAAPDRMRTWIEGVRKTKGIPPKPLANEEDAFKRLALNHRTVPPELLRTRVPWLTVRDEHGLRWKSDPLHRTISPVPFFASIYKAFASRITCPVLAVSGGSEGFHPADEAERLAAFRSLALVEFPGAGHMVHWTRARELSEKLVDFFAH